MSQLMNNQIRKFICLFGHGSIYHKCFLNICIVSCNTSSVRTCLHYPTLPSFGEVCCEVTKTVTCESNTSKIVARATDGQVCRGNNCFKGNRSWRPHPETVTTRNGHKPERFLHTIPRIMHTTHVLLRFVVVVKYRSLFPITPVPAWISNHMASKVWVEINHPFLNFNVTTVEVWQWVSNFIPHIIMDVTTLIHAGCKVKPC